MRLSPALAILAIVALYPSKGSHWLPRSAQASTSDATIPAAPPSEGSETVELPLSLIEAVATGALAGAVAVEIATITDPPAPATALDMSAEAVAETAEEPIEPQERVLTVARGDTLAGLLDGAGVEAGEAHAAIEALSRHFRPNTLRPGDEIAIRLTSAETPSLMQVELEPEPGRTIRATRQEDGSWADGEALAPRSRYLVRAAGSVDGGLFPAMTRAGLPPSMALSLIQILGHQVDFQRDLQPGDRFSILFDRIRTADGDVLGHGQILKATLTVSGRQLEIWRYKNRAGDTGWYDTEGRSLRRSFLRTPLDGARISSGFGRRSHPVLGYNRMHQGIDFAAPTGTPVYAAGEGTIVSAKREGGYGNLVRLRHPSGVETRYAHLSRFGRNMSSGRRVRQGDVIGYVGSTGMSTGPHLHYEIAVNGRAVNPARHVQPPVRLAGADLTSFRARQRTLTRLAAGFASANELAMAPD